MGRPQSRLWPWRHVPRLSTPGNLWGSGRTAPLAREPLDLRSAGGVRPRDDTARRASHSPRCRRPSRCLRTNWSSAALATVWRARATAGTGRAAGVRPGAVAAPHTVSVAWTEESTPSRGRQPTSQGCMSGPASATADVTQLPLPRPGLAASPCAGVQPDQPGRRRALRLPPRG